MFVRVLLFMLAAMRYFGHEGWERRLSPWAARWWRSWASASAWRCGAWTGGAVMKAAGSRDAAVAGWPELDNRLQL